MTRARRPLFIFRLRTDTNNRALFAREPGRAPTKGDRWALLPLRAAVLPLDVVERGRDARMGKWNRVR